VASGQADHPIGVGRSLFRPATRGISQGISRFVAHASCCGVCLRTAHSDRALGRYLAMARRKRTGVFSRSHRRRVSPRSRQLRPRVVAPSPPYASTPPPRAPPFHCELASRRSTSARPSCDHGGGEFPSGGKLRGRIASGGPAQQRRIDRPSGAGATPVGHQARRSSSEGVSGRVDRDSTGSRQQ